MAKKPARTWAMVLSLGIPLAIVGAVAMAISYATLIDVARVNGLPLPELFPILIDVGTVATMIAASQFRLQGISGRWLAYVTFILLSGVSIVANATHAGRAADMTLTTPWAAAVLASTPPAALLAITHIVMKLIPDEKERAKLQALRERAERAERESVSTAPARKPQNTNTRPEQHQPQAQTEHLPHYPIQAPLPITEMVSDDTEPVVLPTPLRLIGGSEEPTEEQVRERVLEYVAVEGKRPTGKTVGEWLAKTPKTGQRFLKRMEDEGAFDTEVPETAQGVLSGV